MQHLFHYSAILFCYTSSNTSLMRVLTSAEAKAMQTKSRKRGSKNARAEVLEIQRILMADIRNLKTPPHIRAACARAWEVLEERLRILNCKPLPGQLRPDLEQRRTSRARKPKAMLSISSGDLPSSVASDPSQPASSGGS